MCVCCLCYGRVQETFNILKTCLSIQPRTGGKAEGEKTPDEIAQELAVDIFTKLPEPLLMSEAGPRTFMVKGEHMDSLATVLGQVSCRPSSRPTPPRQDPRLRVSH